MQRNLISSTGERKGELEHTSSHLAPGWEGSQNRHTAPPGWEPQGTAGIWCDCEKIPNHDKQAACEVTELSEEAGIETKNSAGEEEGAVHGGCALPETRNLNPGGGGLRKSSGIVLCSPLSLFPLSPLRCLRQRLGLVHLQRLHLVSPQHNHDLPHSPLQFMTTMTSRTSSL